MPASFATRSGVLNHGHVATALTYFLDRDIAVGCDEHAVETTLRMISYTHMANTLYLGHHEFIDLRAPTNWAFLESLGEPCGKP